MKALLIALPTTGRVEMAFMTSMLALCDALTRAGIPYAVKPYQFSDIVMSRNYLMSYFLSNTEYDRVLMLDSDLSFAPEQFFRLWEFGADFTAAIYPFRRIDPARLGAQVVAGAYNPLPGALDYVIATGGEQGETPEVKQRDGFQTVTSVGAGFLLLRRAVPERMVETGAARSLPRTGQGAGHVGASRFADFFSHQINGVADTIYGEDESFCRRWRIDCGGDIWVDKASRVTHHGSFAFQGDASVLTRPG